jgi:signal recognition particle subunit SEC65
MSSSKSSSSSTVGATVSTFRGTSSHEFMKWLAERKKFLVDQGVHHIILDGRDSQGKIYNPAMDFKIFEPDLFIEFFNTEVFKSRRRDEEEALTTQVLADRPWLIAYWSKKQIIVGRKFRNAKAIEIPSKDEVISCLEDLNLIVTGSRDMPYPTIKVASCTPAELAQIETKRSALQVAANAGDLAAIDQISAD